MGAVNGAATGHEPGMTAPVKAGRHVSIDETRDAIRRLATMTIPEPTVGAKMRTVEALLGWGAVLAGAWLLLPWWDTFASVPTYGPLLASNVPEWGWGTIFLSIGAYRLWTVLWGGKRDKVAASIGIAFVWLLFTTISVMGNPGGLGPPLYGALTVYSLISLYRIAGRR